MLQNRVDPSGNIIKTSARGAWMGNRGHIHNEAQVIVRPFRLKAWLTCKLEFRGRKRQVMAPNFYTELFFLDEATAFAAGHRPCFECRRDDYNNFKALWLKGNPEHLFDTKTSIQKIDDILHRERMDNDQQKVTYREKLSSLPDGTFILLDTHPYLIASKKLYQWSPFGYDAGKAFPENGEVTVLTPRSIVNTFQAGYDPQTAVSMK